MVTSLQSPFEIETPNGAEGWEQCYPYYRLFREERKQSDGERFWFHDGMHHPEPLYPFDDITAESWWLGLGQYNSRVFLVPPALGIEQRVLNGYLYISPVAVQDPKEVERRHQEFRQRAGYYYSNWDQLYAQWKAKVVVEIRALEAICFCDLPEQEPMSRVENAVGYSSAFELLSAYNSLVLSMYKIWQYHFEFLNLGYAAYLAYYTFCKEVFPGITDQTVARMVSGIEIELFRPDDELKRLSQQAIALGIFEIILNNPPAVALEELAQTEPGKSWIADYEQTRARWFNYSGGTGFYHLPGSWKENAAIPFEGMKGYIRRILAGENIARPLEYLKSERERIFQEYAALLRGDAQKKAFCDLVQLARTVFPYVEEHNFYVEHWHHSVFWEKMRSLGGLLHRRGVLSDGEDVFYLNRFELSQVLYDVCAAWAVGVEPVSTRYWQPKLAKRRQIFAVLKQWTPPPYLGKPPTEIKEPFTIMLWGVTNRHLLAFLGGQTQEGEGDEAAPQQNAVRGHGASRGIVQGRARVIQSADQLEQIQEGEILVCPITTPSWAPIFNKLKATVTNLGGIMSHAAIVCREYGLPAVVGTGDATTRIKTGQLLHVDGNTGVVTLLGD